MKIKTELPTEPGAYWWRRSESYNWTLYILKTDFEVDTLHASFAGRKCGFWCRIPIPDEAASGPVRVAAEAMLTAFKNAEHNWHDYVQALDEALEATK